MIEPLVEQLEAVLGEPITGSNPISGGDIAISQLIETLSGHRYFLKYQPMPPPGIFRAEAAGLNAIKYTQACSTPGIIAVADDFLLLEYIEAESPDSSYWPVFGRCLADMHRNPVANFGFERDNYCGNSRQPNPWTKNGHQFFAEHRLGFQAELAEHNGLINTAERSAIEALAERLPQLLPEQPACLLHGDLWSGNHLCKSGMPVLIDPAAYYGWAEADIAMTQLFGGFPQSFYNSYQEVHPLEPDWQERLPIYNLYHLLNHLNLFGGSYYPQVMGVVGRFS